MAKRKKILKRAKMGGQVMFPSKYLCAEDLRGKPIAVTIESVKQESVRMEDNGEEVKWMMRFVGAKKALIVNQTNAEAIVNVTGKENAEGWVGEKITLFPTRCLCYGQMVDCIRVQERVQPPQPQEVTA